MTQNQDPHISRLLRTVGIALALVAVYATVRVAAAQSALPDDTARIHYQRADATYDGWVLHVWEDTIESVSWSNGLAITGFDDYGAYWDVRLSEGGARLGFIVHKGDLKDPGPDMFLLVSQHGHEVWLVSGSDVIHTAPPLGPPAAGVARIHYLNPQGDYEDWVLHVWEDTIESVTWDRGLPVTGTTGDGIFWDVRLAEGAEKVGFIVHRGDEKDPGPDMFLNLAEHGQEIWVVSGSAEIRTARPDLAKVGGGDLSSAKAHWVEPDLILWDTGTALAGESFSLYSAPEAGMTLADAALSGWEASFDLSVDPAGMPDEIASRYPHLAGYTALRLASDQANTVPALLRTQLAVTRELDGQVVDATGLQLPGVIDALYVTDAPLGVTWNGATPTLSVWAPTALSVKLQLYPDSRTDVYQEFAMQRDAATGVWSVSGEPGWRGAYYLYEVEVYSPAARAVVRNLVTDPYSLSLSLNSTRSQIVDLADPELAPVGWDALVKPAVADPVDITVYELHVRDFSAADATVPADLVGKYPAFTLEGTHGTNHLRALADAGLTHLHLLPTFDIATIDEDPSTWATGAPNVQLPYAGPDAQAFVESIRDSDAFNWGYDPYHYNVPEGSYSTDADGTARILEYRQMVMALWDMGLRVVSDVVYNHTNAAGQAQRSVLDRIVPGYYHRLDANGNVTTSTCCQNTATEHKMMERLMVDSVVLWAEQYKIDAFRFDLMGHHIASNMAAVRAALDALTPETNGVHGAGVYVYGEGWDFGEVGQNARGLNATQVNMAGTGIGTFNDRLRDAVRGGGPFDDAVATVGNQGFASGRYWLPNASTSRYDREAERLGLLAAMDQVRVGLAGNLADFYFQGADGELISGADVDYNGSPAGYGRVPQDHIVYVSKHDNQTLWDILAYKLPTDLPTADRVRLQNLALSLAAFSQGVPFFHAGSDLLRSKSFDRNSYDSGDWFNAIDWTGGASGHGNGMGLGLPRSADNQEMWSVIRPLLANPLLMPSPTDAAFSTAVFQEWLSIRRDEPLLRLRTADDILARLSFHNTGPDQVPGVIVMQLRDDILGLEDLDPTTERLLIVFNASPQRVSISVPEAAGLPWLLHGVQAGGADATTLRGAYVTSANGRVTVPPLTTAVFKAPRLGR
ncbi:MAG: pullulanase-type alpha-1,6-glucosidase [Trueperaceae bacterium]|nr:pullulanase-type alpha-1,6-glucosidase [Trueperaceae bacterium]